jgi:Zn-finger protein
MRKIRYIHLRKGINGGCWYCGHLTRGTLNFPNGDEVWCCKSCAFLHGKIKRFKNSVTQIVSNAISVKNFKKIGGKSEESSIKIEVSA